jgi:hypothetical protein
MALRSIVISLSLMAAHKMRCLMSAGMLSQQGEQSLSRIGVARPHLAQGWTLVYL